MLAFPGLGEDAPSGLDGGGVFNDRFVQAVGRGRDPGPYLRLMGGVQRNLSVVHAVLRHARSSLALARQLGPGVAHRAGAAFTDGMQSALITAAVAVALAAIAVAALLRRT